VVAELLEKGRPETITDELAGAEHARSDGAPSIVLTREGSTFTRQQAREHFHRAARRCASSGTTRGDRMRTPSS